MTTNDKRALRVAHFADLHYCPKHLEIVDRAFAFGVEYAREDGAQVAVIAGDSFDASMGIHEPAFARFVERVTRLAEHMPVLILQGTFSHDRPGSLDALKHLGTSCPVLVADQPGQWVLCECGDGLEWLRMNHDIPTGDEWAPVVGVFSVLPSVNKAFPGIQQLGPNGWASECLGMFSPLNLAANDAGVPSVLVSHGTVTGAVTESGYAMVAPDHEFTAEALLASGADAVMLGHIHQHQSWAGPDGRQIAYTGSITRLVYGHQGDVGFLLWRLQDGRADFELINTPAPRLVELKFDGPPDMDELTRLAATVGEDARVRIRWNVDEEHAHAIDKAAIRELFALAGGLKLEGTVNPIQSVRAAGIGRAVTLEEKMAAFLATTGDSARLEELSDKLRMLREAEPQQVADRVLGRGAAVEMREAA